MKNKYYQVYEYLDNTKKPKKRLIWTFDNEMAAHEMIECILKNDFMDPIVGVEEYEVTA